MTRTLVTGGAGFLGAAVVRRLLCRGDAVRVLDLGQGLRGGARLAEVADDIEYIDADVRCAEATAQAARGMERIIHLAAVTDPAVAHDHPSLVVDVSVRGTLAVLDACRRVGVGELFIASTPEVCAGEEAARLGLPDVLDTRHAGVGGKIAAELVTLTYACRNFDRVVVFRPHDVYGPAMGWDHVIPRLIATAAAQIRAHPRGPVPMPLPGDGSGVRAYLHVEDFAEAMAVLLARAEHRTIHTVAASEELTLAEAARRVVRELGREAEVISGAPSQETPHRIPDGARLRALGFTPRIPFAEGLSGVVGWYLENPASAQVA